MTGMLAVTNPDPTTVTTERISLSTVCCVVYQIINASQNVARGHKLATETKIKIKQHRARPKERQGGCVLYGDQNTVSNKYEKSDAQNIRMKRGWGRLSKNKRRERGRCSVTYASQLFYNHVPLRQTRFLGCLGWKSDISTYSSGCHRHTHTANRRHDNVYATTAIDARTVRRLLAFGPSTQNVAALLEEAQNQIHSSRA